MRIVLGRRSPAAAGSGVPRICAGPASLLLASHSEKRPKRDLMKRLRAWLDGKSSQARVMVERHNDPRSQHRLELLNELRGRMREIEIGQWR